MNLKWGLMGGALMAMSHAGAVELTFDPNNGVIDMSRYGHRIIAADDSAGLVSMAGGPAPNVQVRMTSFDAGSGQPLGTLIWWDFFYGDLTNVAIHGYGGIGEIMLVADPGTTVTLDRFRLAGWPQSDQIGDRLLVINGLGNALVDLNNYIAPGVGYREVPVGATSTSFRILFYYNWNIGLDDIKFSGRTGSHLVGTVPLGDWNWPLSGMPIQVELLTPGTDTVEFTLNVVLDEKGTFAADIAALGEFSRMFDVRVGASHWLKRRIPSVGLGFQTSAKVTFDTLINGDIDQDAEIGIGDYALLSSSYGSTEGDPHWEPNADLDGDAEVGIGDYAILSTHYGEAGE
ncbi:MAG: hypothetical protein K1X67_04385 [Fimbriimonadaceae bacterium]|nr:hypothetical protein [Fimbriimonadaceae bacterium]